MATTTLENYGLDSPFDYVPNIGRKGVTVNTVMSNASAFGGANAALLAGKMKGKE
jgi:3-oxoacyl-(acyl-carrier-protein) synthase